MTVTELLNSKDFNKSNISLMVFGNKRIISDKQNCIRYKKWETGDYEAIAKYFYEKHKINLQVT